MTRRERNPFKKLKYRLKIRIDLLNTSIRAFIVYPRKWKNSLENRCQEENASILIFLCGMIYPLIRPVGHLLPVGEGSSVASLRGAE